MPRLSLTAALANLADLRRLRKSLDAERSATVRGEDRTVRGEDRQRVLILLRQIDVDRLNVNRAIRDALDLVARLLAERARAANRRPAATRGDRLGGR